MPPSDGQVVLELSHSADSWEKRWVAVARKHYWTPPTVNARMEHIASFSGTGCGICHRCILVRSRPFTGLVEGGSASVSHWQRCKALCKMEIALPLPYHRHGPSLGAVNIAATE